MTVRTDGKHPPRTPHAGETRPDLDAVRGAPVTVTHGPRHHADAHAAAAAGATDWLGIYPAYPRFPKPYHQLFDIYKDPWL